MLDIAMPRLDDDIPMRAERQRRADDGVAIAARTRMRSAASAPIAVRSPSVPLHNRESE